MSLPDSWVETLFARLAVRYGTAWTRLWEGIDAGAVRADWANELAGLETNPEAIKHGLANLPADRPPTVTQFRALCIARPEPKPAALPAPTASEESVKAAQRRASRVASAPGNKAWAHALRRREQQCERLSITQRSMWREALKSELRAEQEPA